MSEAVAPSGFEPASEFVRRLSDERLVKRASVGDDRAFAAIFRRYHQGLYRYCMAIVGNPDDAADALQNTMVKVMRALSGEQRQIQLKPWLYRIAHNESIEVLRRRLPSHPLDPDLAALAPGPAERAEQRTGLRRLLADLGELPDRQQGALVMRELAGLDFEEIGVALGTSAATARQTLYEARLSLRQMEEGRELSCDAVTRVLSDADGRVTRRRDIRAHLRECQDCRRFREELRGRRADLAGLAPLPAAAAAGILQGILGGGGSAAGTTGAGLGAAGAGKVAGLSTVGGVTLAKGAATVAVVAVIGVGAADHSRLVDAGLPGGSAPREASTAPEPTPVNAGVGAAGGAPVFRDRGVGTSRATMTPEVKRAPQGTPASTGAGAGLPNAAGEVTSALPGRPVPGDSAGQKGNSSNAAAHGQGSTGAPKGEAYGQGGKKGASGQAHGNKGGNGNVGENGVGGNQGNGQGGGAAVGGGPPAHPAPPPKPTPPPSQAGGAPAASPADPAAAGQAPASSSGPEPQGNAPAHTEHPVR